MRFLAPAVAWADAPEAGDSPGEHSLPAIRVAVHENGPAGPFGPRLSGRRGRYADRDGGIEEKDSAGPQGLPDAAKQAGQSEAGTLARGLVVEALSDCGERIPKRKLRVVEAGGLKAGWGAFWRAMRIMAGDWPTPNTS